MDGAPIPALLDLSAAFNTSDPGIFLNQLRSGEEWPCGGSPSSSTAGWCLGGGRDPAPSLSALYAFPSTT